MNNIVPENVSINAGDVSVKTKLENLSTIERRIIDGKDYFLIPANSSTINDIILANPKLL